MSELDSDIKEGFLCPVCHKDLRTPNNLLAHFQELHSEEQDLLKSIKDLMGKAKKKILKLDEYQLESFKTELILQKLCIEYSPPQEPGCSRIHTDYFKLIRRERLDHRTTETNKLIIRLDKLLKVEGSDRKQKEQELVTWLEGTTVTRCPSCASSFNLTRRQHHCRLCGSIMCHACSYFLTYETAKIIVAPVYLDTNQTTVEVKDDNDTLRLCVYCMDMLECRRTLQMSQVMQPKICQLYMKLRKIQIDLQPSIDLYIKMYNSLTSGDSTYHLQDAQSLRMSIAKHAETIDSISKQIQTLPPTAEQSKAPILQMAVRRAASQYIKEYLLTLPVLPSFAELEKMKRERILRNVEVEHHPNVTNIKKVAVTTGWSPNNVATEEALPEISEDPLIQQINIVRNYIEQAKTAHRFEEVNSLRENLKLLKQAYHEQQNLKSDTSSN